jgi:hypothetical protein
VRNLDCSRKLLPIATCLLTFALLIAIGAFGVNEGKAQFATAARPPAQTPAKLEFEVVSIRPGDPLNDHQSISFSGSTLTATITVKSLIERAYEIRDFQVVGAPRWLDSAKYDIIAKSDEMEDLHTLTPEQQDAVAERQMQRLRSLLADRFQLKFHHEKKELPAFALVVAKGGPKLQQPKAGEAHRLYSQGPAGLPAIALPWPNSQMSFPKWVWTGWWWQWGRFVRAFDHHGAP